MNIVHTFYQFAIYCTYCGMPGPPCLSVLFITSHVSGRGHKNGLVHLCVCVSVCLCVIALTVERVKGLNR